MLNVVYYFCYLKLEVDILLRVIKTRRCGMCFLCLFRTEQAEATIYNYADM